MKTIFILTQESCVDGEILFNVTPCATLEVAQRIMEEEIRTVFSDCPKYAGLDYDVLLDNDEAYDTDLWDISMGGCYFHITCTYDDYCENFEIFERQIME